VIGVVGVVSHGVWAVFVVAIARGERALPLVLKRWKQALTGQRSERSNGRALCKRHAILSKCAVCTGTSTSVRTNREGTVRVCQALAPQSDDSSGPVRIAVL
jgi:hypothetical protein